MYSLLKSFSTLQEMTTLDGLILKKVFLEKTHFSSHINIYTRLFYFNCEHVLFVFIVKQNK